MKIVKEKFITGMKKENTQTETKGPLRTRGRKVLNHVRSKEDTHTRLQDQSRGIP